MCGIMGYVGPREAAPLLLEGLRRLEYRGYDSAGIAVANGAIDVRKAEGKIERLAVLLDAESHTHGRFFNAINRLIEAGTSLYVRSLKAALGRRPLMLGLFALGLVANRAARQQRSSTAGNSLIEAISTTWGQGTGSENRFRKTGTAPQVAAASSPM